VAAVAARDEPGEDGIAVEVRQAQPVDRAALVDEGGGASVAEQAVARDAVP